MTNEISRRGLLAGLAGLVGASAVPNIAEACGTGKTVLDVLQPIIANQRDVETDADGKIYFRFDGDLKSLNDISRNPENYDFTSSNGKERAYPTLEEALKNREPQNRYVIEVLTKDSRNGLYAGQVSNVYDLGTGHLLKGYSMYRCLGSPLKFEDPERRLR